MGACAFIVAGFADVLRDWLWYAWGEGQLVWYNVEMFTSIDEMMASVDNGEAGEWLDIGVKHLWGVGLWGFGADAEKEFERVYLEEVCDG